MIKKIFTLLFFPFMISAQTAFISGNHNLCDNESEVLIEIDFVGTPPFSLVFSIDNVNQSVVQNVYDNPYFLRTNTPGIYTITSFNDATSAGVFNGSAQVFLLPSPQAIINSDKDTLSVLNPVLRYNDVSIGSISARTWIFGDDNSKDFSSTAYHVYLSDSLGLGIPAIYQDSLIVIDNNGCSDTAIHTVWVQNEYWMYIPNAFSPDNDMLNDKLCIEYHSIREQSFLFKIFNAQGDLMYQSTNPVDMKCSSNNNLGWNGKHFKTQKDLPSDTYVYEIYFQDFEGWKHTKYGTITLVR
jgi:gliding motility-associated-like protein